MTVFDFSLLSLATPTSTISVDSPESPSDDDILVADSSTEVTLSCDVGSLSDADAVWTRDGTEFDRGKSRVTVTGGASGHEYSCIVANEAGSAADAVNIRVAGETGGCRLRFCEITVSALQIRVSLLLNEHRKNRRLRLEAILSIRLSAPLMYKFVPVSN